MMMLNHSQPRSYHSKSLLNRGVPKRAPRKETFTISRSAVTPSTKLLISQLLCQVDGNVSDKRTAVSALKQNCLVEFILDEWSQTTRGQLKHFNHFCTYTDSLAAQKQFLQQSDPNSKSSSLNSMVKATTEAYSVIFYGKQTPISLCCNQLICF